MPQSVTRLPFAPTLLVWLLIVCAARGQDAGTEVRLVGDPALSPDGSTLAFSWRGDVWTAPIGGGEIRRLTVHGAQDSDPVFSPDGSHLAFVSDREGAPHVFTVPVGGGIPERRTDHSEGFRLAAWTRSEGWLTVARRDHFWRHPERIILRPEARRRPERLLFDGYGEEPSLSADGRLLLYQREGTQTFRKGYVGSQEAQVWLFDRESGEHRLLHSGEGGSRSPRWLGAGRRYVYLSRESGTFNLVLMDLESGERRRLTDFDDDGALFPAVSADGETIVFRRLFDLHRVKADGTPPERIALRHRGDATWRGTLRNRVERADEVAFSEDAREIAFVAGGDLFVMDTVLREPVQVTATGEEERSPLFVGNERLLFVGDREGRCDVWEARRRDPALPFWRNAVFDLVRITDDEAVESDLRRVPGSEDRISLSRGLGEVVTMNVDGTGSKTHLDFWDSPDYEISPDGRWIAWSVNDDDFNSDVWIAPLDGSRAPFNVSCHPDNDRGPTWSKDGKLLAFTGRRWGDESDIVYVYLAKGNDEEDERDRRLEKALKKMDERTAKKPKPSGGAKKAGEEADGDGSSKGDPGVQDPEKKKEDGVVEVVVDFEGLRDRLRRIRIPDSFEAGLFFAPDEPTLHFRTRIDGKSGLYKVAFPDELKPVFVTETVPSDLAVHTKPKSYSGLVSGVPATLDAKGKLTRHPFDVSHEVDLGARSRAVFDQAWRLMRDRFYDERLGNRDWKAVHEKYAHVANECIDARSLGELCNMMLGELNGSHLGFSAGRFQPAPERPAWSETTGHLGAFWDPEHPGPGLRVQRVVEGTPAWEEASRLAAGDVVLAIDGRDVGPEIEIATVLTGRPDRDVELRVVSPEGEERRVLVRPTTYARVRSQLYEEWIDRNRAKVEELSGGRLGYLHIQAMSGRNLERFDEELYRVGAGRDGLLIDVRENGGGSITDHLLTCLCQPRHAITRPRGGGEGYPQDRRVYATWSKPVLVLCNQNSFSNAEIFSHAIKTLGRGRVVGTPTAGGVISTGAASIMGLARLRMPFRGWYLLDGQDMELNGCVPDEILWPEPGEWPAGRDRQLDRAVELLLEDAEAWKNRPRPALRKASER